MSKELICPECASKAILHSFEEIHCKNCGLVLDDMPPDLSTFREGVLSSGTQNVNGKIVKGSWLYSSREKSLYNASKILDLLASRLNLPEYVKEQAFFQYEKAFNYNICVGRNRNAILHACVYSICLKNIPKTSFDIVQYSEVTEKQMLRAYSLLKRKLGLKNSIYDPIDLLPKYISFLNLSQKVLLSSIELITKVKNTKIYYGKNPKTIVAAVIYLSAKRNNELITQRQIANIVGVMEVTIRKRYKEIESIIG